MTQAQFAGLLGLLLFGVAFDAIVADQARRGNADFTAVPVAIGTAITIMVLVLDSLGQEYGAAQWGALLFAHFAASGAPMAWGSWRRRGK